MTNARPSTTTTTTTWTRTSTPRALLLAIASLSAIACSATPDEQASETERFGKEGAALVDSIYTVDGWMSLEDDYLPRVCTQENGAADIEALKAQAVAARTYLLRAMRDDAKLGTTSKPVINGQSFQAYAGSASQRCIEATQATRGVVGRYGGELIIANYVAGALWNADGSLGNDPTETEKWVTYNEGLTGSAVHPTALSYIPRTDNRGCMSQNGSDWLSEHGHDYTSILRYFFGADLELSGAVSGGGSPGGGASPGGGGCGSVTFQGECSGSVLTWCEGGALKSFNCTDNGKTCGWQDDSVGNNCIQPAAVPDAPSSGCGDVTYEGYCKDSTVVWCEDGKLKSQDCASLSLTCGWEAAVGFNCIQPEQAAQAGGACGNVTYQGHCDGNTVVWCEGGELKKYDCGAAGLGCGYQSADIGHNCM
jgi:hypothetical protein